MAKQLTNEQKLVKELFKLPWQYKTKLVETAEGNIWLASVEDFDHFTCIGSSEEDALQAIKKALKEELLTLVKEEDEFELPFINGLKIVLTKRN